MIILRRFQRSACPYNASLRLKLNGIALHGLERVKRMRQCSQAKSYHIILAYRAREFVALIQFFCSALRVWIIQYIRNNARTIGNEASAKHAPAEIRLLQPEEWSRRASSSPHADAVIIFQQFARSYQYIVRQRPAPVQLFITSARQRVRHVCVARSHRLLKSDCPR